MGTQSKIEWTDATWNPVTGCTKISDGCSNCYACSMSKRLQAMGNPRYINGFSLTLHRDLLCLPSKWKAPRRVFVNSMSDLFHEQVPVQFIKDVFKTMNETSRHNYQVLTKRTERLVEISPLLTWSTNIWQGVTVENDGVMGRIDDLRRIPAAVRFLSLEPLLGPLPRLDLSRIDWVIVGGESGPSARPMQIEWVRSIRDACIEQKVPFFFKQWGGPRKHLAGRVLDSKTWSEYPSASSRSAAST